MWFLKWQLILSCCNYDLQCMKLQKYISASVNCSDTANLNFSQVSNMKLLNSSIYPKINCRYYHDIITSCMLPFPSKNNICINLTLCQCSSSVFLSLSTFSFTFSIVKCGFQELFIQIN